MDISVIVPAYNEEESLPELINWIDRVMVRHNFSYEVIIIDDGSTDDTWSQIKKLSQDFSSIRGIQFARNYGKSAALHEGFGIAQGDVVVTMDADLQDSPEELPDLYDMIINKNYDLVSGWKKKRYDPITKTIPTKLFNYMTTKMSGIELNDFNCGLKAYKNKVVKNIEVYGEMHRYIPVIAKASGFRRIGEKVVRHQARKYGTTKFGIDRFINGLLDLMSIYFVWKFSKRPMHFFGSLGVLCFSIGFAILSYLSYLKIFQETFRIQDRPIFYFAILSIIMGTQLFTTGFLAELVSRNGVDRNKYRIEEMF